MPPEVHSLVTHGLTGAACLVLGAFGRFLDRWRKQSQSEWATIFQQSAEDRAHLRLRVDALEEGQKGLFRDLLASKDREKECLEVAARQEQQIKDLNIETGALRAMLDAQARTNAET